jgi:hypothetical protein
MRTLAASLACLLLLATAPIRADGADDPAAAATSAAAPPQTPEQEVRTLGDYGIAYTTRALQSGAEFYPFAFVMRTDGAIQRIAPTELPRFPTQIELLETLEKGFAEKAVNGKYRAIVIVADVVISMPDGRESDAIQLALEHRDGFCRNVFYPYTLSEDSVLSFDAPLSGKRTGKIFPACN